MDRDSRLARMQAIRDRVTELSKHNKMTRAQEEEFDTLQREFRTLEMEHLRAIFNGEGGVRIEHGTPSYDKPAGNGLRDNAKRVIERSFQANQLPDYAAERATALVTTGSNRDQNLAAKWVTATGSESYRSAFAKLVNDPDRGHLLWTPEEQRAFTSAREVHMEMRAMSLTDANGGYLVPFTLDPAIILTNVGTVNPIRAVSRVVQTVTDSWNGVTSSGVTAEWLAESTQAADASPTLSQPSIPVHKGSAFIPFSLELGMDAGPGFMDELSKLLQDGAARLEATAFTVGSGDGEPSGIITQLDGTASEVAPTTAETLTSPDIYKVQNALPARWQANARWMANLSVINSIDQFETTNGSKKFPNVGDANPVLLRKPLHENSEMDGTYNASATADNFLLLYGDFSQFVVVDRIGTTIELIPHLFGANGRPTGQRGAFMYFRTGSDVTTIDAFRVLNVATAA